MNIIMKRVLFFSCYNFFIYTVLMPFNEKVKATPMQYKSKAELKLDKVPNTEPICPTIKVFCNLHTRFIFYVRRIRLYLYKYRIYVTISIYILKGLASVHQTI